MKHNPSYSQLIIKVTNTKDINPETFLSYNHNKKLNLRIQLKGSTPISLHILRN